MSTTTENPPAVRNEVKPLKVEEAKEIAQYYNAPQSLVNMYWCDFAGVAYPKIAFLLDRAHKRGIQSIDAKIIKDASTDEWIAEVSIHPGVSRGLMEALAKIPNESERLKYWEYMTKATTATGRASKNNVRMSTMQQWLPEMAVKRGLARACRLFAGIGSTAYEELPEAEIPKKELEETSEVLKSAKKVGSGPADMSQVKLA